MSYTKFICEFAACSNNSLSISVIYYANVDIIELNVSFYFAACSSMSSYKHLFMYPKYSPS